jgi:1A family penicillin-binding protein
MGWFLYQALSGLPGRDELRELGETAEGATIFDAYDRPVFSIPTQYRVEVGLARMSTYLRQAVVAVEDARFYDHDGIDGIRIVGALLNDVRQARAAEGASTITQQLARVSFLSRDKTLRRKVREAILALRIERLYSKDEILEIYLNKVYFGDGLYGAEAAARGYFGKPASDLTVSQAAMLAGIIKAPSAVNPATSVQHATERRNVVLKLMREHGFIDQAQLDAALAETVVLHDSLRREDSTGLHFKEIVRRQLIERFGKNVVYQGRLRVYTSIDRDMQTAAEASVVSLLGEMQSRISRSKENKGNKEPLQASLIALDPATGEVRAIVGGRDTSSVGLNRALQSKRQPGSTFKPFVYAAAIENGFSPASVIDRLDQPVTTYKGDWLPEDEHSTASSMTMRTALRTSSNRAAVRVLEAVGIDRAVSYAKNLGVGTVPSVPSLALGSGEVTLASMTAAYGAFADGGIVREPIFIKRVEDQDGSVLYKNDSRPRRAVSETTAFLLSTMLADVLDAGTAYRARAMGFTKRAAGKTGTTNDFVDAWFVGFTPRLVAGVWVGFDTPRTIIKNGFGGDLAVPIWTQFMLAATKGDENSWFQPPPDVVAMDVCRLSGDRPAAGCRNAVSVSRTGEITNKSMVYTEYFVRGTEPAHTCAVHAAPYMPYSEPYFAVSAFQELELLSPEISLPVRAAPPDPVPVAVPAAPRLQENPASALPPPAPPESPPAVP